MNPMKVLSAAFQMYFWHTTKGNDEVKEYVAEIESQILFNGNRIRKDGKEEEKAWFEAFIQLLMAVKKFVEDKADHICDWRGTQDGAGAAAFFQSQCGSTGSQPTQPTPAAAAPEEKKVAPAKPAPAKAAPGKKAPAPPSKTRVNNTWKIENYTDETIRFDDDDDINKRVSFDLYNCNNVKLELVGKC